MRYLHIVLCLLVGIVITNSVNAQDNKEFSEAKLFNKFIENFNELELPLRLEAETNLVSKKDNNNLVKRKEIDIKFADYVPELLQDQVRAEAPRPYYYKGIIAETNQYIAVICETTPSTYMLITYSKKSVDVPSERVISSQIICESMQHTVATIEEDLSIMQKSPQYTGFTTKSPYAISKLQILPGGKIAKMGESRKK